MYLNKTLSQNNIGKKNAIIIIQALLIVALLLKEHYPSRIYNELTEKRVEHQDTKQAGFNDNFYYQYFNTKFSQDTSCCYDIVMIGTSLTQGGDWASLLSNPKIKNLGIPGDISEGILKRIYKVISCHPKICIIECGINDINRNPSISLDSIVHNIEQMTIELSKYRIVPIVTSLTYMSPQIEGFEKMNLKIKMLNNRLLKFCDEKKYHFLNLIK